MSAFARQTLLFLIACFVSGPCIARSIPDVQVRRNGSEFSVSADITVAVDPRIAWQVLTDYNHLTDFVPDLRSSHVISGRGEPLRVEQKGESGFFIFRFPVMVVLALEEMPYTVIRFHSVSGNVKDKGEWRIDGVANPIRLEYRAQLRPDFWVPPLIGTAVVRHDMESQMNGVINEMLRRAKTLGPPAADGPVPNAAATPTP